AERTPDGRIADRDVDESNRRRARRPGRRAAKARRARCLPRRGPSGARRSRPVKPLKPPKIVKLVRAACAVAVCGAAMLALTRGVDAYLKIGTRVSNGSLVTVRWGNFPIRYFVTNRDVP